MRASELIGAELVDAQGRSLGPVRDVRMWPATFEVAGLVVGDGPLAAAAHAWGYAEGRADGPWLLRRLFAPAVRRARLVPVERVASWGPGRVTITGSNGDLPRLGEEAR